MILTLNIKPKAIWQLRKDEELARRLQAHTNLDADTDTEPKPNLNPNPNPIHLQAQMDQANGAGPTVFTDTKSKQRRTWDRMDDSSSDGEAEVSDPNPRET